LETKIILSCQLIGKLAQCDFIASEKRLDCSKFINVCRGAMRPFFGCTTLQVILTCQSVEYGVERRGNLGRGSVAGVHAAKLSGPIVKVLVNMVMDLLKVYGVEATWDRGDSKLCESKGGEVGLCCRELLRVGDAKFVF